MNNVDTTCNDDLFFVLEIPSLKWCAISMLERVDKLSGECENTNGAFLGQVVERHELRIVVTFSAVHTKVGIGEYIDIVRQALLDGYNITISVESLAELFLILQIIPIEK